MALDKTGYSHWTELMPRSFTVTVRDARALREALDQADESQASLARRALISPQRLCQLRNGRFPRVSIEAAAALESALRVPRGSLFHVVPRDAALIVEYLKPTTGEAA